MLIITATTNMQTEVFNKYFYFTFGKMQDKLTNVEVFTIIAKQAVNQHFRVMVKF